MMLPPDSPPDDMCDPMCDEERGAYNESSRLASERPPLTRPLTPNGPASAPRSTPSDAELTARASSRNIGASHRCMRGVLSTFVGGVADKSVLMDDALRKELMFILMRSSASSSASFLTASS